MPDAADQVLGFLPGGAYDDRLATRLAAGFNVAHSGGDEYSPEMETMRTASGLGSYFDAIGAASAFIIAIFVPCLHGPYRLLAVLADVAIS